jgi:hypothetical protein
LAIQISLRACPMRWMRPLRCSSRVAVAHYSHWFAGLDDVEILLGVIAQFGKGCLFHKNTLV